MPEQMEQTRAISDHGLIALVMMLRFHGIIPSDRHAAALQVRVARLTMLAARPADLVVRSGDGFD